MMTDIVERLRELSGQTDAYANSRHHSFITIQQMARESTAACRDAADEIERLRKVNTKLQRDLSDRINDIFEHDAEIERLRELFRKDGEDHAAHVKELVKQHETRMARYVEEIERLRKGLERIRNENQVRYIQIGNDPNENGPTIQTDGPFAKIASATLKEEEQANEPG